MNFIQLLLQKLGLSAPSAVEPVAPPPPESIANRIEPPAEPPALPIAPVAEQPTVETPPVVAPPVAEEPPASAPPEPEIVPEPEPAPEIVVRAPTRPLRELLKQIERLSAWDPPAAVELELKTVLAECRAGYPDQEQAIQEKIQRGQEARKLVEPFYKLGTKYGAKSSNARQALDDLCSKRPDLMNRAEKSLNAGEGARRKWQESQQLQKTGQSASQVKPRPSKPQPPKAPSAAPDKRIPPASNPDLHPQDIRGLQPAAQWTLLIDETGSVFDGSAEALKSGDRTLGRLVGLLLPERHGLKPLPPRWHAVEQGIAEIDRVIQAVLDTPAGVLGVTVQQLPAAAMERWTFGVLRLIDLVLRLLPLDGPTTLTVQIEQRAEFKGGMEWPAIAYDALLRLAQAYPERAARIQCQIRVIGKEGSPFNGYVDALAFIWSAAAAYSRECLKRTGFEGTCYLPGDAAAISRAWEWLDRGITLEGGDWATLLAQPEATQPASLAGTILERLGQASQADATLWQRYLTHTLSHLESKAIDLSVLGRQVEWLERWSPSGQTLPPPARLLWLTAKLARANHLGHTEQPWLAELQTLGDQLLEENAHLVCRAELNLAVNATNRYDFALAGHVLDRWRTLPKAVPGSRYWAQVQSSFGQHAAFQGDPATAVALFDQALAVFGQLSNPEEGQREASQTRTYRTIALMDDPAIPDAAVYEALTTALGPLPEMVTRLAVSEDDRDKYAHHLLLRTLICRPDAALRTAYLAQREQWRVDEGHPWPLIQLYRGCLLRDSDPNAAQELALEGFRLATASDQGPVVQLIGATIRAIAVGWGEPWTDAEMLLQSLETALPLAQERVATVRRYLAAPCDPLELLRAVLPFNFH